MLKRAYPIGGRLVQRLREDWLEWMGLWVTHQVGYDVQCLNEGGQTYDYARSDVVQRRVHYYGGMTGCTFVHMEAKVLVC